MLIKSLFFHVLTIFCLTLLFSCSDSKQNDSTKSTNNLDNIQTTQNKNDSNRELEEDGYTLTNRIDLDYLLLRNQPEITNERYGNFKFHWLRAYDCEYSAQIKDDESLYNSIVDQLIADVLADRMSYPNKFKSIGKISVIIKDRSNNEGVLTYGFDLKRYYTGAKYDDTDCVGTQVLPTRHNLELRNIRPLLFTIPDEVLNKVNDENKRIQIDIVVKFTFEKTRFKYLKSQNFYRIYHFAKIEELALYINHDEIWNHNPFKVFYGYELYE